MPYTITSLLEVLLSHETGYPSVCNQVIANISDIHPKDTEAPPGGVDDMTRLSYLHEPGVLDNLAVRYAKNIIYVSDDSLHCGKHNYYASQLFLMLFS